MKKLLLLLLLFVPLLAISKPKVKFKSHATLIKEATDRAKLNMLDSASTAKEILLTPSGLIYIELTGTSVQTANPSILEYIIELDGIQTQRVSGTSQIPTGKYIQGTTFWTSFDSFILDKDISKPFKLYIVNSLLKERYVYLIDPLTEKVTPLKE